MSAVAGAAVGHLADSLHPRRQFREWLATATSEEVREEAGMLAHSVSLLVEVVCALTSPSLAEANINVLYGVLNHGPLLDALASLGELPHALADLRSLREHALEFTRRQGEGEEEEDVFVLGPEEVLSRLVDAVHAWRGGDASAEICRNLGTSKFTYQEQGGSREFFEPFSWELAVAGTTEMGWAPDMMQLIAPADAGVEVAELGSLSDTVPLGDAGLLSTEDGAPTEGGREEGDVGGGGAGQGASESATAEQALPQQP
jgi:hypothetical protein